MTKIIGRLLNVGLGKESSRGTAVAATGWLPKTDFSFQEAMETVQDESAIGVISDVRDNFVMKRYGKGDIGGNIEVNTFGLLLLSLLGSVSSSTATTGAYSHLFTVNNVNNIQALTISVNDPIEGDLQFPLACLESLTISAEEGKQVTFKATFMSKKGASASHTVTYSTDYKLISRYSIFKLAANLAGLGAASAIVIKSFEISFKKNLEADYALGSQEPRDFINKQFAVEGSVTAIYEDTATFQALALAGTKKAVRFQLIDTNTTIGVSSNPTLTIDLPLAAFTEFNKSMGNDEVVTQTLTFKGLYSIADTAAVKVTLVNTTSSY